MEAEPKYSKTELLYMEGSYLYESKGQIVEIVTTEAGDKALVLDKTIFYPQGGGQPTDTGVITSEDGFDTFKVGKVSFNLGWVQHIGIATGEFKVGDIVLLRVDSERRMLNTKLHSAAHLLDYAVGRSGLTWQPTKAFQFPEGPYVEYAGIDLTDSEKMEIKAKIQKHIIDLINEDLKVKTFITEKSELSKYCKTVPDYIPEGKPVRVVIFGDLSGIPCGGTHVKSTKEIGEVSLLDITSKKGNIRVRYVVK